MAESEAIVNFSSDSEFEPTAISPNFDNIPEELKAIPHWVLWKYEYKTGRWTKPPYQPNGGYAKSTDPQTWSTFDAVKEAYEKGGYDGVGIVITEDMGMVGIDFDHCLDPYDQECLTSVWGYLHLFINSYTEISPSMTGLRCFVKGVIPVTGTNKGNVEFYKAGRYLTVTGRIYDGFSTIEDRHNEIIELFEYVINPGGATTPTEEERGGSQWSDDYKPSDEIMRRFYELLDSGFKDTFYKRQVEDRSAHEFSICCTLAETGFDCNEIMAIMCTELPQNGSKWKERADDSYRKDTIEMAIQRVSSKRKASDDIVINISEVKNLNTQVEMALSAMVAYNTPPTIFKQEMKLCRVVESTPGQYTIDRLNNGSIRHLLATSATWMKSVPNMNGKSKKLAELEFKEEEVYPPKPVVEAISGLHMWEGIPWLMGMSTTPIITSNGEIVMRPGFDEKTGFYYAPPQGFTLPPIPDNPTQQDAIEAAEWLDKELFSDFPFVDDASRTNMLACLLTAVGRTMINQVCPMFLIDKPTYGTGATYLVKIVSWITTGEDANLTKDPESEEEWRKTVFAMLRDCRNLLCFDNVDEDLSSAALSSMLTSENVSARILGESTQGNVPNRSTWIATGNGVRVARDMTRRTCYIGLDAKVAEPWTRTGFRHDNLEKWVKEHRAEILVKIYTVIKAWFVAGAPELNTVAMGSFQDWAYTIGSILKFSGRKDFMVNALWKEELSAMADEWAGFIAVFHERFHGEYVRATEICEWIKGAGITDIVPSEIAEVMETRGAVKAIGNRLSKKNQVRYKNRLMWDVKKDSVLNALTYAAIKPRDQALF